MNVKINTEANMIKIIQLNKFHYSILCISLSVVFIPLVNLFFQEHFPFKSSVWCLKSTNQTNICKFKNICYDPQFKTFLFFLDEESIIKGFNHYKEFQTIELSSVQQHNHFYVNLSTIDVQHFKIFNNFKIYSKVLLLSRFKPNNIMHSIHDDLLPIFLTLESICLGDTKCLEEYGLVFHDDYPKGPFFNLYTLFSSQSPIMLSHVKSNTPLCFRELVTGLLIDSVVYQYGFNKPHGPVIPSQLTQKDISRFVNFLKSKLKVHTSKSNTSEIILLNRQKNRKIINIDAVKTMISKANKNYKVRLINLNLFKDDVSTLINYISNSNALIGMHGAEMILSLFLKPKSYVIEIFPFGINPETLSFIKPFSELRGSNFMYYSWKNTLRNNSIPHPDAHSLFGGITHLNKTTQQIIKTTREVPPVRCCNNPLFLYYMYQDTFVSNEFESFLNKSFLLSHNPEQNINEWFYPYKVSNVVCKFQSNRRLLSIIWDPPFNIINSSLKYNLVIRDEKNLFNQNVITEKTFADIEIPVGVNPKFEIWILSYLSKNNIESPDVYIKCH